MRKVIGLCIMCALLALMASGCAESKASAQASGPGAVPVMSSSSVGAGGWKNPDTPQPQPWPLNSESAVSTSAPNVVYVYGASKRVSAVAAYLRGCGADVRERSGKEVMGQYQGKKWPGVRVSTKDDPSGHEGTWVPVSDAALKKGLCSDQQKLLGQYCGPSKATVSAATSAQVTPSVSTSPQPCASGDCPPPPNGKWLCQENPGQYVEIKFPKKKQAWKASLQDWSGGSSKPKEAKGVYFGSLKPTLQQAAQALGMDPSCLIPMQYCDGDCGDFLTGDLYYVKR